MHAEAEHDRIPRRDAGDDQQRPEHEAGRSEHPARAALAGGGRIRLVADRADDVHPAHAPGREHDHREREEHADGVRDHDARGLHGELHGDVGDVLEHGGHREHHEEGDDDAEERPDGGCQEVVGQALEQEHLHEMAAPCADGPRDAELAAALGCEHDEDQEDQQDARGDRERPERREDRHERGALLVGQLERVLLAVVGLERERGEDGRELRHDLARRADAALVRDEDELDLVGLAEHRLRRAERHQQAFVGRAAAAVGDDRAHGERRGLAGDEDPQRIAGVGAETWRPRRC